MSENEGYSLLSEDLKILKEFFGQVPPTGNQIVILVIGNIGAQRELFGAMKKEIAELKDALRREIHGSISTTANPENTPKRNNPLEKKSKGPSHSRSEVIEALRLSGGNKRKAAEILQWQMATVWAKIRNLKITPEEYGQ